MEIFEEIKSLLGENDSEDSKFIAPFPLLSKNAVESLRYRAEVILYSFKEKFQTSKRSPWRSFLYVSGYGLQEYGVYIVHKIFWYYNVIYVELCNFSKWWVLEA